ncbi:hypothetical protein ABZ038_20310 [Streptomyces sp. NPDC006349]|uniref:hypothetical protein n=1 Tax=Streptomyces sp. NPDC006349 TaxID=3156757 RepID=UPI0033BD185B
MSTWKRVLAPIRRHWRRVFFPVGFVMNVWGNSLYDTPHRGVGLAMFVGGLVLVFGGRRPWSGFTDGWHTPKRILRRVDETWNEPQWKRRWGYLKLTVWGVAVFAVVRHGWGLLADIEREPDQVVAHVASAQVLMCAWVLLPVWGQAAEPDLPAAELLDRLSSRVWRAMLGRTVANAAGIYFAAVVIHAYVVTTRPSLIVPVAVTLGGAIIAVGHKGWMRLRKLSTQLHSNIVTLERDLDLIPGSEGDKVRERQDAARRSWDAVHLDLQTPVDTGYAVIGTPFLPAEMIDDLCRRVERAVELLPSDETATAGVSADLDKIREACRDRIDSVA